MAEHGTMTMNMMTITTIGGTGEIGGSEVRKLV